VVGDTGLHYHHIVPKRRDGSHRTETLVTLWKEYHRAVNTKLAVTPTVG
jgi:5-methylcytosine-specific restriction endonuclease McrA